MAFAVFTESYSNGAVDQGAHLVSVQLTGSFVQDFETAYLWFEWSNGDGTNAIEGPVRTSDGGLGVPTSYPPSSNSYSYTPGNVTPGYNTQTKLTADNDYRFRAKAFYIGASYSGTFLYFRSAAVTATQDGALGSSAITANTANITGNFFPNTLDSIATVKMQYRVQGSGTWIDAPGGTSPYTGYLTQNIARSLTELTGLTTYEYRFTMTRDTVNETTFSSSTATFVTLADAPTVTTDPATTIGSTSAILNGTVDPNNISSRVRFGWGLSDAGSGAWANYTAYQNFSGDGNQTFQANITGLTFSTVYFFRALVEHPSPGFGSLVQGATRSFTTAPDPLPQAAQEDHLLVFDYDALYGTARSFVFLAAAPAASSSDKFLNAAVPWTNTECIILIDGVLCTVTNADGRSTNAPTRIGTTAYYTISLVAAELNGEVIHVWITDAGNAARDVLIRIRTKQKLSRIDVDATPLGSNANAVVYTPHGTGRGLFTSEATVLDVGTLAAASGTTATLASSAVATTDYYRDCTLVITSGTGAGQARVIQSYTSGRVATVPTFKTTPTGATYMVIAGAVGVWDQQEGAEPTTVLEQAGDGSTFRKMMQWFKRRRFNRNTQTATAQTVYRDDATTTLAARTVSDNGTTQDQGEFS